MMRPQPPRLRMKRRKTVSVTPAMGARTVAGAILTMPMGRPAGTGLRDRDWRTKSALSLSKGMSAPHATGLSHILRTALFYLGFQNQSPRRAARAKFSSVRPQPRTLVLRCLNLGGRGRVLGVFATEALNPSGGIHKLLLAGEERMAGRANFYADVALMSGAGNKGIAARAMHSNFVVSGMNGCFHRVQTSIRILRFYRNAPGFSNLRAARACLKPELI